MKKNDYSTLIAAAITILLLIAVIAIFFVTKNKSQNKKSVLEIEEQKLEQATFDVTFINPKETYAAIQKKEYLIVDIRNPENFSENHIESSINIPLQKLLDSENRLNKDQTIIIVETQETQDGKKITSQLQDKGYKLNYLKGGLYNYIGIGYALVSYGDVNSAHDRAKVSLVDLTELGSRLQAGERFIYLDVRSKSAFDKDHFANAINVPLENLEKNKGDVPTGKLLIIDEDPARSFQAAVRLNDMNFLTVYYLTNKYSEFKEAVQNQTLLQ
ncbi:MAG: hypothetical protein KAQ63_00515, partial [Candidatus Moranbacteria bacterium]|nr:hypothetical protein [Candidatus Moranbacteria bacterium]